MKNITLSAPETLINEARKRAASQQTTLNAEFRRWLETYAQRPLAVERALTVMEKVSEYTTSGGTKFTRDQMNER